MNTQIPGDFDSTYSSQNDPPIGAAVSENRPPYVGGYK